MLAHFFAGTHHAYIVNATAYATTHNSRKKGERNNVITELSKSIMQAIH
jgi:hypothetical protein